LELEEIIEKSRIESNWRARVSQYVERQRNMKRRKEGCSPEEYCREEGIDRVAFRWWLKYIEREDRFTYYRSFATEYLSRAERGLGLVEEYGGKDPRLRMPLMRDAITSYAALFCRSEGRLFGKFKLEARRFVPRALEAVHKKICGDRNIIIAHCDIGPREPKVSLIGIGLRGKGFYWEDYEALMPEFRELIEAVRKRLESYVRDKKLACVEEAFQDLLPPPAGAMEDPGEPLGCVRREED
jgi:hypothetical protein